MQINQAFSELRVMNDQPVLRPPSTRRWPVESTGGSVGSLPPQTVVHGGPVRLPQSFGNLLGNVRGTVPPIFLPPPSGNLLGNVGGTLPSTPDPSPSGNHVEAQVRDYQAAVTAVHKDLVSQLKAAQDTLKQARQSGDHDAISAAQKSIDDLNVQLNTIHDSLTTVYHDVKVLREMRQQLIADVKAGNTDAIQQDRDAITQQRAQVLTDIQA